MGVKQRVQRLIDAHGSFVYSIPKNVTIELCSVSLRSPHTYRVAIRGSKGKLHTAKDMSEFDEALDRFLCEADSFKSPPPVAPSPVTAEQHVDIAREPAKRTEPPKKSKKAAARPAKSVGRNKSSKTPSSSG